MAGRQHVPQCLCVCMSVNLFVLPGRRLINVVAEYSFQFILLIIQCLNFLHTDLRKMVIFPLKINILVVETLKILFFQSVCVFLRQGCNFFRHHVTQPLPPSVICLLRLLQITITVGNLLSTHKSGQCIKYDAYSQSVIGTQWCSHSQFFYRGIGSKNISSNS